MSSKIYSICFIAGLVLLLCAAVLGASGFVFYGLISTVAGLVAVLSAAAGHLWNT